MSDAKTVFEILVREHAETLLAFLRASLRDSHAVDDVFQETLVVAWRRLDDFDKNRSFGKWLRGIAAKLMLAHFRKTGRNPLQLDASALSWMEGRFARVQSAPGDTLGDKLELLRDCVEALPDEKRITIRARYFEQCSLEEIVERTQASLETVKKRLYRAKLQLETCLERKLPSLADTP